jgi:hypothetical protein
MQMATLSAEVRAKVPPSSTAKYAKSVSLYESKRKVLRVEAAPVRKY